MGEVHINVILPVDPIIFGVFMVVFLLYFVYKLGKFFISIWTGA